MEAQVSERAPDGVGEFGSVASTGCAGARVGFPFCWRCVPVLASTRFVGVARGVDASPRACMQTHASLALTCSCARRASRACFRLRIRAPGIFHVLSLWTKLIGKPLSNSFAGIFSIAVD